MSEPLDLEPIKAREAAASAQPWTLDEPYEVDDKGTLVTFINGPEWWYDGGLIESQADAAFIAHARSDVPALVAEVKRLRAVTAELVDHLQYAREVIVGLEHEKSMAESEVRRLAGWKFNRRADALDEATAISQDLGLYGPDEERKLER